MAVQSFLICFCAALIQVISGQIYGMYNDGLACAAGNNLVWEGAAAPWAGASYAGAPYAAAPYAAAPFAGAAYAGAIPEFGGYSPANLAASNGGGLSVTSSSPIAPTGVAMTSENAYEGVLAVNGALPFLAAVSLEGVLPTVGAGAVMYGCGNGNVGMVSEDIGAAGPFAYEAGIAGPFGYEAGIAGPFGYEAGIAGPFGYEAAIARPFGYEGPIAGPAYGYNAGMAYGGCGAIY